MARPARMASARASQREPEKPRNREKGSMAFPEECVRDWIFSNEDEHSEKKVAVPWGRVSRGVVSGCGLAPQDLFSSRIDAVPMSWLRQPQATGGFARREHRTLCPECAGARSSGKLVCPPPGDARGPCPERIAVHALPRRRVGASRGRTVRPSEGGGAGLPGDGSARLSHCLCGGRRRRDARTTAGRRGDECRRGNRHAGRG